MFVATIAFSFSTVVVAACALTARTFNSNSAGREHIAFIIVGARSLHRHSLAQRLHVRRIIELGHHGHQLLHKIWVARGQIVALSFVLLQQKRVLF